MFRFHTNPLRVIWNVTPDIEVTTPCHKITFTIFKDQIKVLFSNGAWEQNAIISDLDALDVLRGLFDISVKDHLSTIKIGLHQGLFYLEGVDTGYTSSVVVTMTDTGHKFFQGAEGSLSLKPLWDVFEQIDANIRSKS